MIQSQVKISRIDILKMDMAAVAAKVKASTNKLRVEIESDLEVEEGEDDELAPYLTTNWCLYILYFLRCEYHQNTLSFSSDREDNKNQILTNCIDIFIANAYQ